MGRREGQARLPEAGHVGLEGKVQSGPVVALAVSVETGREPIPSGMEGIETSGTLHQCASSLPVARIRGENSEVRGGESIHGVKRDGPFRGVPEGLVLPPAILGRGQGMIGEMIRWRGLDGAPRG